MTRDETVALFLECEAKRTQARAEAEARGKPENEAKKIAHDAAKAHWNSWAQDMLAERKAMEADGRWAATIDTKGNLVPENSKTDGWMQKAAVNFSRCIFVPGMDGIGGTQKTPEKEKWDKDGELPDKPVQLAGDKADFSSFGFPGIALFNSVTFTGGVGFASAIFSGDAWFDNAIFSGDAWFGRATFSNLVRFKSATFSGDTSFDITTFASNAVFDNAAFSRDAWFRSASFTGMAWFTSATFTGSALFANATFAGICWFTRANFTGNAQFTNGLTFERAAYLDNAKFDFTVSFAHCNFRRHVTFEAAQFESDAAFTAVRGDRGFSMTRAVFKVVPDFIQAHFEEAPRLDNLRVEVKLPPLRGRNKEGLKAPDFWQRWHRGRIKKNSCYRRLFDDVADDSELRNIPARWRALKRLAIQGHDTERELEFHAREIRSQRFVEHWPLPWLGKSADVMKSVLSFWFGFFYEAFSNFGRSLTRPAAFWLAAIVLGAVFYASQSPDINREMQANGAFRIYEAASKTSHAWLVGRRPCFTGNPAPVEGWDEVKKRENLPGKPAYAPPPYIGALSPELRIGTDIANEAWHLAFRNAFIVLDGSNEATHRTYGCLYGVELYGGSNPLAVVPSAVSTVSAAQKLFSALMIFLFGLALRNMLKMK